MADLKSWNLWHGCRKYSEGCANCYMFVLDKAHKVPKASTAIVRTKRVPRIAECLPADWGDGWENVDLNMTCENQRADNK